MAHDHAGVQCKAASSCAAVSNCPALNDGEPEPSTAEDFHEDLNSPHFWQLRQSAFSNILIIQRRLGFSPEFRTYRGTA
jgi:hypothetical protein